MDRVPAHTLVRTPLHAPPLLRRSRAPSPFRGAKKFLKSVHYPPSAPYTPLGVRYFINGENASTSCGQLRASLPTGHTTPCVTH